MITKRTIEKELGIPVLVLEGDCYDTRNYSAGQLRTRVETFAELLRAAKAAKTQ
jgi:benzoyl-CoA reductase/2-hydroxyglutaryl-CoA dehydratase subunit BcrC/BadD/HgdB